MKCHVCIALAFILLPASIASAQESSVAPPDSVQQFMRSALRALATGQEQHYTEHGTYGTDLAVLKKYPGCEISDRVRIVIHHASENGYAAESLFPGLTGQSCVQWFGRPGMIPGLNTQGGLAGEGRPGIVVCDFDPYLLSFSRPAPAGG